jgi:tRNA modification GTPase
MSDACRLRLVQLTPPGRGAIATLRIEGPGALRAVAARFPARNGRPLTELPRDRLAVGHFGGPGGEEVVVRTLSDEALELHCHGGVAAVALIEETLAAAGASGGLSQFSSDENGTVPFSRRVAWQEWAEGQERDPIAAAARIALAEARTERTAAILLDQYHGALRSAIRQMQASLRAGDPVAAAQEADALLARAPLGLHLVRPWQVVVAGLPNAGKSSLINALAGYRRAIVHPTAGTTRDVLSTPIVVDGWPVELSDTAGLPPAEEAAGGDPLEQAGIKLAQAKLAAADLALVVFDRSRAWSAAEQRLQETLSGTIRVHNKCDLPPGPGPWPPGLAVSALKQEGIEDLLRAVADRLVPQAPPAGAAVPFTPQQIDEIARAATGFRSPPACGPWSPAP